MKKLKYIIPFLIMSFASCDNYLDINDNPNELHTDQATPDQYLAAAQVGCYRVQATTMNRLGILFTNYAGGNVQSFASPFQSEFTFSVTSSFYSGIYEGIYLNVNICQKIIDYPDTTGKYEAYKIMAKILKAHYMQYLVDLYGDVPYTDVFKGLDNVTPKYNDDQFVYRQLIKELNEAREMISNLSPNAEDPANLDVMLGGVLSDWQSFANTIELRMLLRMSKSTGAVATWRDQQIAEMVTNGYTTFVGSDVKIQPGYSESTSNNVNPLVYTFGWDQVGNITGRNSYAMSGHLAKCLNPYSDINYSSLSREVIPSSGIDYPGVLDPRRFYIFSRASTTSPNNCHKAVTQGSVSVDVYKPGATLTGQPSKFANQFYNPYNEAGVTSLPTTGTGNFLAANSGYVMTLAESLFLQAEAAHLGTQSSTSAFASFGLDAQTSFDLGVQASFSFYGAPIGSYLTTIDNSKPNYGYNASFNFDQNYHAIMYQKWLALANNNAIESYIDNTRTSYPKLPLPLNVTVSNRPIRLIYPTSEYVANSANVPNIGYGDLFTVNSTSPFWLQGNPPLGN